MPTPAHHRARVAGTLGAAAAHGYLAVLAATGYLNYTVPTRYRLIDEIASDFLWLWIHAAVVMILLLSLRRPTWQPRWPDAPIAAIACSIAFSAMATWAFFNLLWGLSTVRPVSLAGPGLALVVAAGEHLLANAWIRGTHNKGR